MFVGNFLVTMLSWLQQYKLLAQKISIIEQKAVKTPQDEADLAELQAKQHQILSTGRPVFTGQQPSFPTSHSIQPNVRSYQSPGQFLADQSYLYF